MIKNRTKIEEAYAERCVEDMDIKTLSQFVYDIITDDLSKQMDKEFMELLKDGPYPEFLEQLEIDDRSESAPSVFSKPYGD